MKRLIMLLIVLGTLAVAFVAAVPLFTKWIGPRLIRVPPPTGDPIGEFDTPKPETSVIAVRVEIPVSALEVAANREAPREIGESERRDFHRRVSNGTLQWQLVRGDISLSNTGRALAFSLPMRGAARATGLLDARILTLPIDSSADLAGTISGTMEIAIDPNWRILPNLTPTIQLTRADLSLGRIGKVSARSLIEDAATPIIQREAAKLGPDTIGELDLGQELQRLWDEAHVVEKINDDPPAWFIVDPDQVSMGPVDYSVPDRVSCTIAMIARSFVANTPAKAPTPEPLPQLALVATNPVNDLRIPIVAHVSELNKALREERFVVNTGVGARVELSRPEVRVARQGKLNLSLFVEGERGSWGRAISGRIWLEGLPVVDYEAQTLGFTEVSLTVETRQTLSRTAAWLLDEILTKSIERELRADLADYLPEIEEETAKWLATNKVPQEFQLALDNTRVELLDVYTITRPAPGAEPDPGIVVVLGGRGAAAVKLTNF